MNGKSLETTNAMARIALITALVFALSGLVGAWCAPPDGGSDRMARKMNVLEKIFDEVLRESPNVFVSGGGDTSSLLLEGYGALFIFEGSLTGGGWGNYSFGRHNSALGSYFRGSGESGEYEVVAPPPSQPPKDGDDEPLVPDSMEDLAADWEAKREDRRKEAQKHLAGLKAELAETLLDYGATLGELTDDQWVVVAAFIGDYNGDGPEQLVLKVKMRDLRQYSAGQLSLDQAKGRVTIEEK